MSDRGQNMKRSRRRFLAGAAALSPAIAVFGGRRATGSQTARDGFTPKVNGYGFRNWSTENPYFATPTDPEEGAISDWIRADWERDAQEILGLDITLFPKATLRALARQTRNAVVQRAGTNGHCYGMVLSAQQYFEQPGSIPVNRPTASDIETPTIPIEEPEAPVYDDIVESQASQYLRFRSWLGRRALFYRDRIDTRAVLSDLQRAVETFGTAAAILYNDTQFSHQVLVYDITKRDGDIVLSIYDPNRAAPAYASETRELRFTETADTVKMAPYKGYTGILYNRYDRIEMATGRLNVSPLDHLTVGRPAVRESLFPLVLATVDAEDAVLSLVGPDGAEGKRIRGSYMDVSRGDCAYMRSIYGARAGTHRIRIFGAAGTEYELDTVVTGAEETQVNVRRAGSVDAGDVHEYELTVPTNGDGTVRRLQDGSVRSEVLAAAGVAGGLAAGALGYRALAGRKSDE